MSSKSVRRVLSQHVLTLTTTFIETWFRPMSNSELIALVICYCVLSGSVSVTGLVLIAKHFFFPKPPKHSRVVQLIDLGLDGSELSSQSNLWTLRD
jgi:hypothetical protein